MIKYFFLGIVITVTLLLQSCGDTSVLVEDENKLTIVTFQPTKAWRGDTITILSKGTVDSSDNIIVMFDEIAVKPFYTKDSILKAIVPAEVERKEYSLFLSKKGKTSEAHKITIGHVYIFQSISIEGRIWGTQKNGSTVSEAWYDILYDGFHKMRLYNCDSLMEIPSGFSLSCNKSKSGLGYSEYDQLSVKGSFNIDTKTISELVVKKNYSTSSKNGPGSYQSATDKFDLQLKNSKFTEFDDRVEIVYPQDDLNSTLSSLSYISSSDNGNQSSNYSFKMLDGYKEGNSLKIKMFFK